MVAPRILPLFFRDYFLVDQLENDFLDFLDINSLQLFLIIDHIFVHMLDY
jgi:hypothetical protein